MRTTTSSALLLATVVASGCTATDACLVAPGHERTLLVQPPDSLANDTTNQYAYRSIAEALNAARAGDKTTVCVAAGIYREANLVVPAGVHLRGAGPNKTRLRPTDTGANTTPTGVDQVLLELAPSLDERVIVSDLEVSGAAVCAQVQTEGDVTLTDVRLADCGIGLRAVESGDVLAERLAVAGHRRVGIELRGVPSATFVGPTEWTENGRGDLLEGESIRAESQRLFGVAIGGALRAQQVGDLLVQDVGIEARAFRGGQLELRASDAVVQDVSVDLFGIGEGGAAPALLVAGGSLDAHAVRVRTQGQGLLATVDAAPDLTLDSVAWGDVHPLADGEQPGLGSPALALDAGAVLDAQHLTLRGTNREPAIRLTDETELTLSNSVLWGFGNGQILIGAEDPPGLGVSFSLVDDSSLEGNELILGQDPQFEGNDIRFRLADGSPARCAGNPGAGRETDLWGDPRPAEAGKDPDLGAVEHGGPCP